MASTLSLYLSLEDGCLLANGQTDWVGGVCLSMCVCPTTGVWSGGKRAPSSHCTPRRPSCIAIVQTVVASAREETAGNEPAGTRDLNGATYTPITKCLSVTDHDATEHHLPAPSPVPHSSPCYASSHSPRFYGSALNFVAGKHRDRLCTELPL